MSAGHRGTLIIRPICAKLTRDTETFGKMDPYCKIVLGTFIQKTKIADGAGKFPNWQDQLVFKWSHEDTITVEVWDYDSASKDDLVGSATVPISRLTATRTWEDWIEITHRGTRAGEVRLGCEFTPDAHGAHGQGHAPGPNIIVVQGYPPYPGYPPQHGYPPQQGYPPQPAYPAYPPQQAYPPQGYPPQAYPPQGYPPQSGYPPQGYPPQAYPPQGYPPQAYPPQGYPPQPGYPPQGYPQYPPSY